MRSARREGRGGATARRRSDVRAVGMFAVAVQLDLGRLLAVVAAVLRARRDLALATGVRAFVLLSGVSHSVASLARLCARGPKDAQSQALVEVEV